MANRQGFDRTKKSKRKGVKMGKEREKIEIVNPFEFMALTNEAQKVYHMWDAIGGSFVKGLAQALLHADPINMKKIHDTWPNEWNDALEQFKNLRGKGEFE